MNHKATIFDIQRCSFSDGPGIRTTVFFKGCNLRCAWCHNPESWSSNKQRLFYKNRCTECGKCMEICPNHLESCDFCGACERACENDARKICGKSLDIDEILKECLKDKNFYETSGGGVTFSGGECMLQIDALEELLKKCKENDLHTAVDTAGHVPYEYFERIMSYVDVFLYDIKCLDSEQHKYFTGVGNEQILDNLKRILSAGKETIIRIPVIAGVNDSIEEMIKIKKILASWGKVKKVELLPYHEMGKVKAEALSQESTEFQAPSNDRMETLKNIFS